MLCGFTALSVAWESLRGFLQQRQVSWAHTYVIPQRLWKKRRQVPSYHPMACGGVVWVAFREHSEGTPVGNTVLTVVLVTLRISALWQVMASPHPEYRHATRTHGPPILTGNWMKPSLNALGGTKECKTWNMGLPRSPEDKAAVRVSPSPNSSFHLQLSFPRLSASGSGADCSHVTRTSGWQSLALRGCFCRNRMASIHMCHYLILRSSPFSVTINFDDRLLMAG